MRCPLCDTENEQSAAACFTCGRAFDALTQGALLSNRYEVRRSVGSGGMGRVYEAFDRVLEEPVAIKVLRAELTGDAGIARRFISEIRLARKVTHPNVCRMHEYGEDSGLAYISMEYIRGRSLKDQLALRPLTRHEAFDVALQIGEGLAAIHGHGIVHRDFKSANIMVDEAGRAKILDFGIAKQAEGGMAGWTGDRVFGTPEYMSPEQAHGEPADARSDLYALACVVFEAFTGQPPFRGDTPLATLLKQLKEPPPLDEPGLGLPPALVHALAKALAKEPAQRFGTVAEFLDAMRAARDDGAAGVVDAPRPSYTIPIPRARFDTVTMLRAPTRLARGSRRGWAVAGVLLVAVAVSAALLAPSRSPAPASDATSTSAPPSTQSAVPSTTLAVAIRASAAVERPAARPASAGRSPETTPRDPERAPPSPAAVTVAALVTPPTSAPLPAPGPSAVPATGTLALIVVPEADVTVDGGSIGTVGRKDIPLAAGAHALEIVHPDYQPLPRRFTIRSGETLTLVLDLQEKGIRKAAR